MVYVSQCQVSSKAFHQAMYSLQYFFYNIFFKKTNRNSSIRYTSLTSKETLTKLNLNKGLQYDSFRGQLTLKYRNVHLFLNCY